MHRLQRSTGGLVHDRITGEKMSTEKDLLGALEAYRLAIDLKTKGSTAELMEIANDFGRKLSTSEAMLKVFECFNWREVRRLFLEDSDG